MDVLCERCGEPWDTDYVRHDMTQHEQDKFWAGNGCPCCHEDETPALTGRKLEATIAQKAMHDVLGDDLDGLASTMEDLGLT